MVLFESGFVDPTTLALARVDDVHGGALLVPDAAEADILAMASDHLVCEFGAPLIRPVEAQVAILRQLLGVLLIRLSHLAATEGDPVRSGKNAFGAFRVAVEERFTQTRQVVDYAHLLGYSVRTLSRATEAAAGVSSKQFIDQRVVLEAKRLLAHTDWTAATIAQSLGFSSATNFSKYFRQRTGVSPLTFRCTARGVHDAESGDLDAPPNLAGAGLAGPQPHLGDHRRCLRRGQRRDQRRQSLAEQGAAGDLRVPVGRSLFLVSVDRAQEGQEVISNRAIVAPRNADHKDGSGCCLRQASMSR